MHSAAPAFSWSDAWLLHAVAWSSAQGPASLEEIVGMGDAIEKAVFSFEELSSGLAKLEAAGFVRSVGSHFELEPSLKSKVETDELSTGLAARAWFEKLLKSPPWSPEEREVVEASWQHPLITREGVDRACEAHRASTSRMFEDWLKEHGH